MSRALRISGRVVLGIVLVLVALTVVALVLAHVGGGGGISRLWGG